MESLDLFLQIGTSIEDSVKGNLFGKDCFKIQGKPFICHFQHAMVFKLNGETHANALSLDGSQLFDPSGKGRLMKEWVQVPMDYSDLWEEFAKKAKSYVLSAL